MELVERRHWLGYLEAAEAPLPCTWGAVEHDFEVQARVLGEGMAGAVRAGACRHTGRLVAVKRYWKHGLTPRDRTRLRSEVEILSSLDHQCIVQLVGSYETKVAVHLVMEQLGGGEVYDRVVEQGRLSEKDAAVVAVQVLQAAAFLHSRGIIHRDIKPENLIYTEKGGSRVKLIDFGFAIRLGPKEKVRETCGSMQYMAPETFAGLSYDTKADVWSIGSLLYSMLTGKPAYVGSKSEVERKSRAALVDFSDTFRRLPEEAQELVHSLLALDPRSRPSAAEALRHPWLHMHAPALAAAALAEASALGCAAAMSLAGGDDLAPDQVDDATQRCPDFALEGKAPEPARGVAAGGGVLARHVLAPAYRKAALGGSSSGPVPSQPGARRQEPACLPLGVVAPSTCGGARPKGGGGAPDHWGCRPPPRPRARSVGRDCRLAPASTAPPKGQRGPQSRGKSRAPKMQALLSPAKLGPLPHPGAVLVA